MTSAVTVFEVEMWENKCKRWNLIRKPEGNELLELPSERWYLERGEEASPQDFLFCPSLYSSWCYLCTSILFVQVYHHSVTPATTITHTLLLLLLLLLCAVQA